MNYGDMLDTLVRPVIDELVSGSNTSNQIILILLTQLQHLKRKSKFSIINTNFYRY